MGQRIGSCIRKTKETDISLTIDLDGQGLNKIDTGIPFFDHMLDGFARHGLFDLEVKVRGDVEVDSHHTIEDTGIVLGQAIADALGDKAGIKRYGYFILPMDETLALCAVDLSGRPYLKYDADFTVPALGAMDTEMVREFFYAVSYSAAMNLHVKIMEKGNTTIWRRLCLRRSERRSTWQYPRNPGSRGCGPRKGPSENGEKGEEIHEL